MEHAHHHAAHTHDEHQSDTRTWLRRMAIGTALAAGAIILAPYILPVVGVGSSELLEESILAMHATGTGSGLAGAINGVLAAIPGVGAALSGGGYATMAATGLIGIGGVLLGRYIEKREDGRQRFRWGRAIKTAALITSTLIAMPSILTGISTGVVFLCAALSGAALASSAIALMGETLGSTGTSSMAISGVSGAALALPHLLTCGSSLAPVIVATAMTKNKSASFADRINQESAIAAGAAI
ncbi:MAG: hypothetical protein SFW63_00040 [Alphaproteobacteria bacterium]|nr:hypothetical protein [Alphaproteobacteria bacterium]